MIREFLVYSFQFIDDTALFAPFLPTTNCKLQTTITNGGIV